MTKVRFVTAMMGPSFMQMPRLRFRLGWLMLAVVAAALILWGHTLWRRHETYQHRAVSNAFLARQFREAYETRSKNLFAFQHGPVFAVTPELRLEWAEYHETLARLCQRAGRHPWEALPPFPDPPETFRPSDFGGD
jgi:hypothetical protein